MMVGTPAAAVPGDEALLSAVLAAANEAFVLADDTGRIVDWNPAAERTFGFSKGEVLGLTLGETIVPPALRAAHQVGMERFLNTGEARVIGQRLELTAIHKHGHELPVELTISAVQVAGGRWRFAALMHDISQRRMAEAGLRQLAAIVETVDAGIVALTPDGFVASWNPAAHEMLGHPAGEMIGRPFAFLFAPGGEGQAEDFVRRSMAGETVRRDTSFAAADGRVVPVAVSVTPLRGGDEALGVSVLFRDITRHKVAEERLAAFARRQRELAKRDDLTGLFNLRSLQEGLSAALKRAQADRKPVSVAHVDLQGIRAVNASRGPEAGDDVLRAFGRLLAQHAEAAKGWAARIAGDEFALVLPDTDRLEARRAASAVRVAFLEHEPAVEVAFGVACSTSGARTPEALLHDAERDGLARRATG